MPGLVNLRTTNKETGATEICFLKYGLLLISRRAKKSNETVLQEAIIKHNMITHKFNVLV